MQRRIRSISFWLLLTPIAGGLRAVEPPTNAPQTWRLSGKVVADRVRLRQVAGARVIGKDRLHPDRRYEATSDPNGNFELQFPKGTMWIVLEARDPAGQLLGYQEISNEQGGDPPPRFLTVKPIQDVTIQVIDGEGHSVEGAQVDIEQQHFPVFQGQTGKDGTVRITLATGMYSTSIVALKSGVGYDYFASVPRNEHTAPRVDTIPSPLKLTLDGARTLRLRALNLKKDPIPGVILSVSHVGRKGNPARHPDNSGTFLHQKTDAEGIAKFDCLPMDMEEEVFLFCPSEDFEVGIDFRLRIRPKQEEHVVPLLRKIPFSGQLLKSDGTPAARVEILFRGQGAQTVINREIWTDSEGSFEIRIPQDSIYSVYARSGDDIFQQSDLIVSAGQPLQNQQLKMVPGTVIRGRFLQKSNQRSFARQYVGLNRQVKPMPPEFRFNDPSIERPLGARTMTLYTDIHASGDYRFAVGPGNYTFYNPFDSSDKRTFTVINQKEIVQDFQLDLNEIPFRASVVDPDGKAVGWATLTGIYPDRLRQRPFEIRANKFGVLEGSRKEGPVEVFITSPDRKLSLVAAIDKQKEPFQFELQKLSTIKGRILDQDGNPKKNALVHYRPKIFAGTKDESTFPELSGKVATDADGRYLISGLTTGAEWNISLEIGPGTYDPIKDFFLVEPADFDLGDFIRVGR